MSMGEPSMIPWFSQFDERINELNMALRRIATVSDVLLGTSPMESEGKPPRSALVLAVCDRLSEAADAARRLAERLEELVPQSDPKRLTASEMTMTSRR